MPGNAVTKLIFLIKRIYLKSKKVKLHHAFFFLNARNLGWSDDAKRRKKGDGHRGIDFCLLR